VLINRSTEPIDADVNVSHAEQLGSADAYAFTSEAAAVKHVGSMNLTPPNALRHTLPPMSATVVRMAP
jgi:hypothetical protein